MDRCRICYVSHNTNYKLQKDLTAYAIGSEARTTLTKEKLHQDPNLNYAASVAVVLTRLPRSEKLTPIETMKLAAGEVAGGKEAVPEIKKMLAYANRVGISIVQHAIGTETEVEKYLKKSGLPAEKPELIRLDSMGQDADEPRLIEGIKRLIS